MLPTLYKTGMDGWKYIQRSANDVPNTLLSVIIDLAPTANSEK